MTNSSVSRLWWNAYSALLLATVGTIDVVFLLRTVPGLARSFHDANQALPLALRILIWSIGAAPWFVLAAGIMVLVMRLTRLRLPEVVKTGALPAVTWLVVTSTLIVLALTLGQLRPAG